MYYGGYQYDVEQGQLTYPNRVHLCYAESQDGVHWIKPDPGHVAVFKDANPDCPPDAQCQPLLIHTTGRFWFCLCNNFPGGTM
jgi:hypothetical protein